MPVVIRLPKVTRAQFEKVSAALVPTSPPGLLIHVSFGEGDEVEGLQVWESEEAWASDMPRVLPALQEAGLAVDQRPTPIPALSIQGSKVQEKL